MSLIPLESLSLKIQGFQLTFSQLLNELSGYAKILEIETNAKNDLTFEFCSDNSSQQERLLQERYSMLGFKMDG